MTKTAPAATEIAAVLPTLEDIRAFAGRATELPGVRAVVGTFIPSGIAHALAGFGIAAVGFADGLDAEAVRTAAAWPRPSSPSRTPSAASPWP